MALSLAADEVNASSSRVEPPAPTGKRVPGADIAALAAPRRTAAMRQDESFAQFGDARPDTNVANVAPAAAVSSGQGPASQPRQPTTLGIEIAWLDAARRALSESNAPVALSILERYDRDFPNGALAPEAAVLRVEAMVKAGNRTGAIQLAERLAGTLPDRYTQKIRALLAQESTGR